MFNKKPKTHRPASAPTTPPAPPPEKVKMSRVVLAAIDELLGLQLKFERHMKDVKEKKVRAMTNKEKAALKEYEEGLQKTLDIIAPAGMEVSSNQVQLNGLHSRTLYAVNWPNYIYPNWLSEEINFDAHMNISQFIYPASNKAIMRLLRKKVTQMRSSVRMLEQRGIVRDPTLEAALQDAEELRDLLARGREKLFQLGLYITLYSDDEDRLKKLQTDLESLLGGKLVITKPAFMQMEHGWISTLPFGIDELEINRNMNTSPLAACFPFSSSDLTDDHGILYGINRHNDSLVIFDRFDLPNANANVFATSGAGKSFTVKLEILRSLMFGTEVYVIDPENEYRELCDTVGGTYIPISLQSSYRINPFDLPRAVRGEEAEVGETLRAAVINLHGLFKLMLGTLTPSEDGILDKAILDTYALKDITLSTENPDQIEPPTMHDLVDVLQTTDGGENMAQTLAKFTEGSYAGIFDQHTNVKLENQMVVFQIRDLEEQLRPVAMYVVINLIWNRVRAEFKKRMLVIDEAWNLIQHEDSARFLYGLIKRARKYYLGVTTITQDVEDFVNSPYGKPIITNASLQVLLKQSPTAVDNLQKIFYLTDGEKYLLLNSDVGQGLFFAGNRHVAIQVVASPKETEIITTNPEELLAKREHEKFAKQQADDAKKTMNVDADEQKVVQTSTELLDRDDSADTPFVTNAKTPPQKTEQPTPQSTENPADADTSSATENPPAPIEQTHDEAIAKEATKLNATRTFDTKTLANVTLEQATKPAKQPEPTAVAGDQDIDSSDEPTSTAEEEIPADQPEEPEAEPPSSEPRA